MVYLDAKVTVACQVTTESKAFLDFPVQPVSQVTVVFLVCLATKANVGRTALLVKLVFKVYPALLDKKETLGSPVRKVNQVSMAMWVRKETQATLDYVVIQVNKDPMEITVSLGFPGHQAKKVNEAPTEIEEKWE